MEKKHVNRAVDICEKKEVEAVILTSDGHVFLEKAKSHAQDHARRNSLSIARVTSSGDVEELKSGKKSTGKSNKNDDSPKTRGEEITKDSLMAMKKVDMVAFAESKEIIVDPQSTKDVISDEILKVLTSAE